MHNPYNFTGPDFDGLTYEPELDKIRLTGQLKRVYEAMKDGHWRTLRNISYLAHSSEASASARLRDLRKPKFGGHVVDRKLDHNRKGVWLYRLTIAEKAQQRLL